MARGLSQARLAEIIGTSQPQIDRLEKGERRLSVEWLEKISTALDVYIGSLIQVSDPDENQIQSFNDIAGKSINIEVRKAIQSASSMEFDIINDVAVSVNCPPGLMKIYNNSETNIKKNVVAFRIPNDSLHPRWKRSEIAYLSINNDLKNRSNEEFINENETGHYAIKLEEGSYILTKILGKNGKKFRLYYLDSRSGQKEFFIKEEDVNSIYKIFEWEELLYGWKMETLYYRIADLVGSKNTK